MKKVAVTTEPLDVQSSNQIVTTNMSKPCFLQAGCPSCHPTNNLRVLKG